MEDLDSMIMESKTKKCSRCGLNGAFINCEYPGCHAKYHLPCAHSATDVVLHGSVGHLWCPKHTILGKLMNTVSRIEPIPLNYCVLVYFDLNFVKLQIVIVRKTNVSLKLKIQSMTLTKSLLQEQGVGFRSKSLDKSSMPSRKNRSKYRVSTWSGEQISGCSKNDRVNFCCTRKKCNGKFVECRSKYKPYFK